MAILSVLILFLVLDSGVVAFGEGLNEADAISSSTAEVASDVSSSIPDLATLRAMQMAAQYWQGQNEKQLKLMSVEEPTNAQCAVLLPEGFTDWGFETYVLVTNPSDQNIYVELYYMTPHGEVKGSTKVMEPGTRWTVAVHEEIPGTEVSTLVLADDYIGAQVTLIMDRWEEYGVSKLGAMTSIGESLFWVDVEE